MSFSNGFGFPFLGGYNISNFVLASWIGWLQILDKMMHGVGCGSRI